jgi:hypothetical protein
MPNPTYAPASPTRPYASTTDQPGSPTVRKQSPMRYNDSDEKEGVIGLGLGLGAAEQGNSKGVCPLPQSLAELMSRQIS